MERCTEISNVNFTGENSHPTLVTPLSLYIKDQGLIFFTNNTILRTRKKQHIEKKNNNGEQSEKKTKTTYRVEKWYLPGKEAHGRKWGLEF